MLLALCCVAAAATVAVPVLGVIYADWIADRLTGQRMITIEDDQQQGAG
jgi:hypothetical protein